MRELKVQFANALLVVLTVAAAVSAFVNFQQNFHPEKRFPACPKMAYLGRPQTMPTAGISCRP